MSEYSPWSGPIVDAHQHFWDPFTNLHPWLLPKARVPFRYGDYETLKRRYLPPDYLADAIGHDVVETVYVETEWDPDDPIGETRYVMTLAEQRGYPSAIVAQAYLNRPDIATTLAQQAAFALVRSVRHKPGGATRPEDAGTQRSMMLDDTWRRGFAQLERHRLHFDLQTPWWNLDEAVLLARDFPHTLLILNHTGLPTNRSQQGLKAWHAAMARFAQVPNARVKISGLGQPGRPWTVEANRWIVEEVIAMFGAKRTMFASNFPVDSLCASFDQIYGGFKRIVAHYRAEEQRLLFCDTAREVYCL